MPEPTLSEITNIRVDPELGTGTPAVVFESKDLVRTLNNAAQYKAENDFKKYSMFLNNLKDVYKDVNKIAEMPVMTSDRPYLQKKMGEIISGIAQDPKSFFGGGPKYQEILGKISQLSSDATESKANATYDFAHRQYFYRNPDLDTPENRALIDAYVKQPLGSRNPYLLRLPGMYDGDKMATYLNTLVKNETKTPLGDNNSPFIDEETKITYDPLKYRQLAEKIFEMPNERGIPLRETMSRRFQGLTPELKEKYNQDADPIKAFFLDDIMSRVLPESSKTERKSNPNYLKDQELSEKRRAAKARESIDRGELGLKWAIFNNKNKDDQTSAMTVLNEAKDIISKGTEVDVYNRKTGKNEKRLRIGDPTLLKQFGNVDKDGNVTNVPDFIEYNRDKDQVVLGYYEKDPIIGTKSNNIDKEVSLDQRTWLKEITKRSFPNKDIGAVNSLIDEILTSEGNSLYKLLTKKDEPKEEGGSKSEADAFLESLKGK